VRSIAITTENKVSRILIGESLKNLGNYLPPGKSIIITDDNILRYYAGALPPMPVITIGTGEKHKTMETLTHIFERLIDLEADRTTFIIGIGGGIVCDVAGFAASVYMRGLQFGFVSTTLLSQVDASVGGKNGVNFRGYKNMIGVFNQPDFVICDPSLLRTLDDREYRAGFAEIIKAAAILDAGLFTFLEEHHADALNFNLKVIEKLIHDSVAIKAAVVKADEREKGERRKLNFGHTFAHALEHLTGMLHGEAVAVGMVLAARLSVQLGFLAELDYLRIRTLVQNFGLPVALNMDPGSVLDAMKKDKKREGDSVRMVLLDAIGNAITHKLTYKQLESIIYDLC